MRISDWSSDVCSSDLGGHGEESSCRWGADRRCLAGQERPVPPRGCAGSPGCGWRVPTRDTCHTSVCLLNVSLVRALSDGTVMPVGIDNAPRRETGHDTRITSVGSVAVTGEGADRAGSPGSGRPVQLAVKSAAGRFIRSEEHPSALPSLMRISLALFCL